MAKDQWRFCLWHPRGCYPSYPGNGEHAEGHTHYDHILDYTRDSVTLIDVPATLKTARLLRDGEAIEIERRENEMVLYLPEACRDPYDTVVVLA